MVKIYQTVTYVPLQVPNFSAATPCSHQNSCCFWGKVFCCKCKEKVFLRKNLTRVRLRLEIRRKLDILELACVTVFDSIFAAKHPIAIYYSTIAVCVLLLYCLKEKFNFRSPFLDRLISGGLSSPISLPATATCLTTDWLLQSICSFKVSIKASTLRNRLSRFFFVHKHSNSSFHIFCQAQQYAVTTLVVHYKLISNVSCDIGFRNTFPRPNDSGDDP